MRAFADVPASIPAVVLGGAWALVAAAILTTFFRDTRSPSHDDGPDADPGWAAPTGPDPRHPSQYVPDGSGGPSAGLGVPGGGTDESDGTHGDDTADGRPLGGGPVDAGLDGSSANGLHGSSRGDDLGRRNRSSPPEGPGWRSRHTAPADDVHAGRDGRAPRRRPDGRSAGAPAARSGGRPRAGRAGDLWSAADAWHGGWAEYGGRHGTRAGAGTGAASEYGSRHEAGPGGRHPGRPGLGGRGGAGARAGRRDAAPDETDGLLTAAGRAIRRAGRRPADPEADRRAGVAAFGAVVLWLVAPLLAVVPVAWAVFAPGLAARRAARAHEAAVVDQFPDVVDLLVLTTAAGLPVPAALEAIGDRPGGPLGPAVAAAADHIAHGGTTAEALDGILLRAGPVVRPLIDALVEHDRYGTPLRPILERVVSDARGRRRRQAEEAARRLPVTLLFPLVLTTLPAFFLLAIVPLIAGSLGSLGPLVP